MKPSHFPDPFALLRLQTQVALITVEAGAVIWMRALGWAGFWSVLPDENIRMVAEKQKSFSASGMKLLTGAARGQEIERTLGQTLGPIRATTKANVSRLTKRGPKRR